MARGAAWRRVDDAGQTGGARTRDVRQTRALNGGRAATRSPRRASSNAPRSTWWSGSIRSARSRAWRFARARYGKRLRRPRTRTRRHSRKRTSRSAVPSGRCPVHLRCRLVRARIRRCARARLGSARSRRDDRAEQAVQGSRLGLASRGSRCCATTSGGHAPKLAALRRLTVKEEVVDDARAAVRAARASRGSTAARIFVLGHSLGGMLIRGSPTAIRRSPGRRHGGHGRPLDDAILEQTRYLAMADGAVSPEEQAQIDAVAKTAAACRRLVAGRRGGRQRVLGARRRVLARLARLRSAQRGAEPEARCSSFKANATTRSRWKTQALEERAGGDTDTSTFRSLPGS